MKGDTKAQTPEAYLDSLEEPRRSDIAQLDRKIREIAPELEPTIVFGMLGYGPLHYRYESGREGDTARICLASQKNYISLYCMGSDENGSITDQFRARLPKANLGKGCIRLKRASDIDPAVFEEIVRTAAAFHAKSSA